MTSHLDAKQIIFLNKRPEIWCKNDKKKLFLNDFLKGILCEGYSRFQLRIYMGAL